MFKIQCDGCGVDLGEVSVTALHETMGPGGGGLLTLTVARPAGLANVCRNGPLALYCAECSAEARTVDPRAIVRERRARVAQGPA